MGPWMVVAVLCGAGPLAAQQSPEVAELERRLDALLEQAEILEPRVDAEREAHDRSTRDGLDEPSEQTVDGLRIWALPRDMDAAVELFTATWRESFEPRFGSPPPTMAQARLGYYDQRGGWNPRIGDGQSNAYFVQVSGAVGDRRSQAERSLTRALLHGTPASVRQWTLDWSESPDIDWLSVRRQLASAPSTSAQACLEGDIPSCTATLGLRPEGWDRSHVAAAWYGPEARRDVLARSGWVAADTPPDEISAAQAFLQWQREFRLPPSEEHPGGRLVRPAGLRFLHALGPASPSTRASLLLLAVDLGGPDAMDRLSAVDPGASLETALEAAAGQPLAELVGEWRDRLLADLDPADRRAPARSTLAWVGLLAVFAMTSTRWRLGR